MRAVTAAVAVVLVAATPPALFAQQTLLLANGDRLSGRLMKIEAGRWHLRYAGSEIKIRSEDVVGLVADEAIGIRLSDGTIGAATARHDGDTLVLEFLDGEIRRTVVAAVAAVGRPDDLDALQPVRIGVFTPLTKFWGATAALGFSDKSGNSRSRGIALSIELSRRSPKDRVTLKGGLNRESREGVAGELELTVSKYYGSLRGDVFVTPRAFVYGETRQERDQFQDLDLRSNYLAGLGVQLVASPATDLRFSASGGVRHERFTSGGGENVGILSGGVIISQKLGPAILDWDFSYIPSVKDGADYLLRSDASVTFTVYRGLGFRVGLLNEYDNEPQPGIQKHDMLITTTLTYSVGR